MKLIDTHSHFDAPDFDTDRPELLQEARTAGVTDGLLCAGQDRGGYSGPGPELISAQEAAQREDGAWVALKGVITRSLGDRDYMFEDSSGSVEVAIGPREWKGQRVSAADTVEIHGRVHKDPARVHVHVKRLIKRQGGAI